MGLFNKADPAVKKQLAIEEALKAKRVSVGDLIERRKVAGASAATHRAKACQRAAEGGDDAALSAAEAGMRREQDRVATLSDAIAKVEIAIADLEREIAELSDRRCRVETVAAINALVEKCGTAGAAFDTAIAQLAELVLDASP
jgi:hypothetical protein